MSLLPAILDQIEDADLPIAVYRTAVRIARRLDENGQAIMSWEEFQELTGCNHADAARRHLRIMGAAGLIDWRGGATTVITWKIDADLVAQNRQLLSGNAQLLSENRQLLRVDNNESAPKQAATVWKRAATVGKRAVAARFSHTRALVGGLLDPLQPIEGKSEKPTQQPRKARAVHAALPAGDEQQLAFDLLVDRDIGISFEVAEILAREMPCLDIYRAVDDWLPEYREGKVKTGALVSRIRGLVPSDAPTVTLSPAFRDSELFHRHRLPDEMVAGERRKYSLDGTYPDDNEQRRKYNP